MCELDPPVPPKYKWAFYCSKHNEQQKYAGTFLAHSEDGFSSISTGRIRFASKELAKQFIEKHARRWNWTQKQLERCRFLYCPHPKVNNSWAIKLIYSQKGE